ncbi:unnamed protein product [Dimorphilus gyrociliatus]|uniref:Chromo domain-containing protein n=1 Tax=Dimorphilus gyrociliatus TaxID=2664684 RepID=A0A7I8WDA3_9ANNE|nr:unnamed protein product [Dimorphilus gyrociliatus]
MDTNNDGGCTTYRPNPTINCSSQDIIVRKNAVDQNLSEQLSNLPEGACFVSISPLTSCLSDKAKSDPETISVENVVLPCEMEREPTRFHEAERVLCAEYENGMKYLVKWKGIEEPDYVDGREARLRFPHLVIDFYEGVESSNFTSMIDNMTV